MRVSNVVYAAVGKQAGLRNYGYLEEEELTLEEAMDAMDDLLPELESDHMLNPA